MNAPHPRPAQRRLWPVCGVIGIACLAGCACGERVHLTNTTDEPIELVQESRDGWTRTLVLDPGGQGSLCVSRGWTFNAQGLLMQVK